MVIDDALYTAAFTAMWRKGIHIAILMKIPLHAYEGMVYHSEQKWITADSFKLRHKVQTI